MGLAAFNRARMRQAEEHRQRVKAQQSKIVATVTVENLEPADPEVIEKIAEPTSEPMEEVKAEIGKENELVVPEKPKGTTKGKPKKKGK